ncbi:4-hydroxythreonine-4-phosphate dehydrogenase PdxA [Mesorhizobium sp. B2-5-3]|uniref:4-hydroxythreonine-4-phosphate dehydrogenase PdxA n=1 Tax=Mesorhizobium sp. B2-5-3 TaxID=2589927 RepID=UPI00112AC1FE|nr:4-hydroxythreonine-4-phosphate dehydrogenase PdxA [Mesorhizobium sp. B2-5-3]TPK33948.1 4-hydroxythreonine-4-phosphate dehydrogenase PdxA [Mesorhizobium sp. B2-5-3]
MSVTTIGLVAGDPSGVGPELCAKLVNAKGRQSDLRVAVFCGKGSFRDGMRIAGLDAEIPVVDSVSSIPERGGVALISGLDRDGYKPGVASAEGGTATLAALESAADAAGAGQLDAIVYGPLNKQAMWLAGHKAIDELHFFSSRLGVAGFCCEMNNQGALWTARVTSHIPLRAVADNISVESIIAATVAGAKAVESSSGKRARIAVAGLNPHLGEGGAMGTEEIEIILPAIERLKELGYDVAGLYPADTVFLRVGPEKLDLIITMFHDQGQIALKTLGFANTSTVLGGLPLPIVTASQGTAYDIVGQNRADPAGLTAAFDLAHRLAIAARKAA